MGMPSINIEFIEKAASAIKRGERGIVALILKESTVPTTNPIVLTNTTEIPSTLSAANKKYCEMALTGYVTQPKKVIAYVLASDAEDYTSALNYLESVKFNYLAIPTVATDNQTANIVSWVKNLRDNKKKIKAILPNASTADHEGIINYITAENKVGDTTYTAEQYTPRIAGILAGTPLSISATYAPMLEVDDVTKMTRAEMDTAVEAGKLLAFNDGTKTKLGRAVNSLVTTTDSKNAQFKKIHIVDSMDMIYEDINETIEDNYIGKYANTYDNKVLLLQAIRGYFDKLIIDNVVQPGYTIDIDVEANRAYLTSKGKDVSEMSEIEIKKANTGSNVFLIGSVGLLDAIEDVDLKLYI